MSEETYDVVVLGAGPNGLCCAAYLARAGARVALIEKSIETGGGLVTEELCGFKLNYHAIYMMLGERVPPHRDLELGSSGVRYVTPPAQAAFLFAGHRSFILYTDPRRSAGSIAELSAADADRYLKLADDVERQCEAFLIPATYALPVGPVEQVMLLRAAGELGDRMAEVSEASPQEYIDSFGFEDPRVRAGLLYLTAMFGLDPDEGGMGFLAPIYLHRLTRSALVVGGSHQLSSVLRRKVEEAGGRVLVGHLAAHLELDGDRVAAVRLDDGRVLKARAVVSTLNPEQTFLQLLDGEPISEDLRTGARNYAWEKRSLFIGNWGGLGPAPRYEGYPDAVDTALSVVMGYETPEDVLGHIEEVKRGDGTRLAGHGSVPSRFDPLLVPQHVPFGQPHTLRWESWAPYAEDWDAARGEAQAARCLTFWARYAPNIAELNLRAQVAWSPRDIERHLSTMKRGSIKHGAYTSLQMGHNRPFPECSRYRTPVEGLYLGGASTHPGGMVIFGPGYNAARVVAHDLGLEVWWSEPEMVARSRAAGYLPEEDLTAAADDDGWAPR